MTRYSWIETARPDFRMRYADEDDTSLILHFIRELAEYEKLAHEVEATEAMLGEHLFGKKARAEVILGYEKEQPAAFALFFHNFSTFVGKPGIYLEDLFVKPGFRGNGYGQTLLHYLAKIAADRNCGRLEWSVLDWNKPAIDFYQKLGAKPMNEWTVFRVEGKVLNELGEKFDT